MQFVRPTKTLKFFRLAFTLCLFFLSGCAELPVQGIWATEPSATQQPTPAPEITPTPTAQPTSTPGPVTLRIWLPPQFDPDAGTPGGDILKARLDEFTSRRPGIRIEVRIKALEGPGGLLDGLTTANAAAPLSLPDLIALPRPTLEAAALKGLLHTYDEYSNMSEDPDWYEYAQQLARVQNSTFGIPFAGDALVLVYRPAAVSQPPQDLATALQTPSTMIFPAADPQALFTLALYQAYGGAVLDDQGRPVLEADILSQVLAFFQEGEQSNLTPFWLTQYQSDGQAWEAFINNEADMVITWASRYLKNMLADTAAVPIPTPNGTPFSLATGWVWALASPNPDLQEISAQLAEFLSDSAFLAEWAAATGHLPPRPSALSAWESPSLQSLGKKVALSAHLYPSADVLTSVAPPLEQATVQVLKQQNDPQTAARAAASSLSAP